MARSYSPGPFTPGVNNRRELSRLSAAEGTRYLAGACNVDLSADGLIRRRAGRTLTISGSAHSLWSPPDFSFGMAVLDGDLCWLEAVDTSLSAITVRESVGSAPVSYSQGADGGLYWSNGTLIRRIFDGEDRPIVTAALDAVPAVTPIRGSLPAGRYTYSFTVSGPDGESAATAPKQIELPANAGLRFTVADSRQVNLYLSSQNGDVLEWHASGAGSLDVTVLAQGGRRLRTAHTAPLPAGSIIRHFNGRMLVAQGRTLYVSMPYGYGLYEPARGFIAFPADITLVEPMDGGLYIAADKTYWLANLTDAPLTEVFPFGALARSSAASPNREEVVWQTPRGLALGDAHGAVRLLQDEALAFGVATVGATLWRERDGMRQAIATRFDDGTPAGASTSNTEAAASREGLTYA